MTLNDFERRNGPYSALFHRIYVRRHRKKFTFAISSRRRRGLKRNDEFLVLKIWKKARYNDETTALAFCRKPEGATYLQCHLQDYASLFFCSLALLYIWHCSFIVLHHTHNNGNTVYSARNARIASAVLATAIPSVCPSVRPSVGLSVTRRYCVKTAARSTVQFAPLDSKCV